MRPRPGREYSAEYGSALILICWMADALTPRLFTAIPLTTSVTPGGADRPGVEKLRNRAHDVLIENRQALQEVGTQRHRIGIRTRRGADLRRAGDRDFLRHAGQRQRHADRARSPRRNRDADGRRPESCERDANVVAARGNVVESEAARAVGGRQLQDHPVRIDQLHGRLWQHPPVSSPTTPVTGNSTGRCCAAAARARRAASPAPPRISMGAQVAR